MFALQSRLEKAAFSPAKVLLHDRRNGSRVGLFVHSKAAHNPFRIVWYGAPRRAPAKAQQAHVRPVFF